MCKLVFMPRSTLRLVDVVKFVYCDPCRLPEYFVC